MNRKDKADASQAESGSEPEQKRESGGARYGWNMMGGKLAELLEKMPMSWNHFIRHAHPWVSIVFTLAVIANLVAPARQQQAACVGFLALAPLILLPFAEPYSFVLPYAARARRARRAE